MWVFGLFALAGLGGRLQVLASVSYVLVLCCISVVRCSYFGGYILKQVKELVQVTLLLVASNKFPFLDDGWFTSFCLCRAKNAV